MSRFYELDKNVVKIHMAVFLFGFAGVIGRFLTLPAVIITLGRVVSSASVLLMMMFARKETFRIGDVKTGKRLLIAGVLLAIHWTSFIRSIQIAGVAMGTITFASFPMFVTFLEPILFKEKRTHRQILAAGFILIGVAVMAPIEAVSNDLLAGFAWGMTSSFTYAVLSLINRWLSKRESANFIALYEQSVAAIVLMPSLILTTFNFERVDGIWLLVLGIFCTALAHSMFIGSLRAVSVHKAGIISGMEPVYAILLAALLLGELPNVRELAGGLIILITTYKT